MSLKVTLEELALRWTKATANETTGPGSQIKDLFACVYVHVRETTRVQGIRGQ